MTVVSIDIEIDLTITAELANWKHMGIPFNVLAARV